MELNTENLMAYSFVNKNHWSAVSSTALRNSRVFHILSPLWDESPLTVWHFLPMWSTVFILFVFVFWHEGSDLWRVSWDHEGITENYGDHALRWYLRLKDQGPAHGETTVQHRGVSEQDKEREWEREGARERGWREKKGYWVRGNRGRKREITNDFTWDEVLNELQPCIS